MALFRSPGTLLQPLEATGAVLFVDGEVLTIGDVPSTPELRELLRWVDSQATDSMFSCASVGKAHAPLDSLTPTASGVLAVRLSATRPDYLMWVRREQLHSVTWAGDPSKPMVANNPLELSPRSSFASWSEIVRGTALPWTTAELAMGRAIGVALVDIIVQVHAVRLLIAQHQLSHVRATVLCSSEPVLIADARGRQVTCNEAFALLTGCQGGAELSLAEAIRCFEQPERMQQLLDHLQPGQPPWRGEMSLARPGKPGLPVSVRAEQVAARDGTPLGTIITLFDLSDTKRAAAARRHLEDAIRVASHAQALLQVAGEAPTGTDQVISGILTNASLAAMDIADGAVGTPVARLLEELEASTQRATALYTQMRELSEPQRR
jgi:PAS domain-containing protein